MKGENPFLWKQFTAWAVKNNVSLENEEDYTPWFECFTAGAQAAKAWKWSRN